MPYHEYYHFVTTIPRLSNLNYSQFVESVNRAMNASQAPQSSCFGSDGLTNEGFRRINGPISSTHADVRDATERLHLDLYADSPREYPRDSFELLTELPPPSVRQGIHLILGATLIAKPDKLFQPFGTTTTLQPNKEPQYVIEKAFQKQQGIFQNAKVAGKKSVKNNRWYKEVGLGFKTPKEAIEGHYIDKKCPFTGDVSIRGRILTGEIISTKMKRTIIIRREYLHFISKYNRYEKRHKNLAAHLSPAFIAVQQGDTVTVGQCRPLSKTVRFNVLKVQKKVVKGAKNFAKF
ncbi:hypothetical protein KI688_008138 [Linnemannia hyalina]|uniref:Small ribosomal subunit protein uS17 N-terminal domain-containing protein n=1 Tax=Linnemannia hyalina TaxID=64524 RepID=A0A9P8BW84_9FUNG|nr:hypothetical protein KI688_008138 [Linnemannia hyalina]